MIAWARRSGSEKSQMPRCRHGLRYFIIFALTFLMASLGHAATDPVLNAKLEHAIAEVRISLSPMERSQAAEHLADLVHRAKPSSVDDRTIADMVTLLDNPDDSVRAWTAGALGHLGRRAKVAAPKLLALLTEVDCLEGDLTSAATIRPALERMGVKPPAAPSYGDCHKPK
jgi:hypothetical protein